MHTATIDYMIYFYEMNNNKLHTHTSILFYLLFHTPNRYFNDLGF